MHLHPPARQAKTCLREPQGPCQPSNKYFAKYARSPFLQKVEATWVKKKKHAFEYNQYMKDEIIAYKPYNFSEHWWSTH